MNFRFGTSIIIILSSITKQSLQNCVSIDIFQRYYSHFSSPSSPRYIQCQNEILSSNFHEKVQPLTKGVSIQWLEVNNTDSPEIAAGAFSTLSNLLDIRINGARIHVIQPGAFDGLKYLNKLSLKNNKINELKEHYFANLTNLAQLDLSFNNIASIAEKCFVNLKYLNRLVLQNNFLTALPPNIFKELTRIEVLDLSYNKITTVDNKLLTNLTTLKTLSLNNNNLNSFDGTILSTNSFIKELYINNNYLTKIRNLSVANSLRVVNASSNFIRSLSFSTYTYIQIIDLSASGITSIKNFSFKNLAVSEIYLDRNHLGLNPIERETFGNLSSLELISLSDNQIKELGPDLFKNNTLIKKVNLSKNYLSSQNLQNLPLSIQELDISYNNFNSQVNVTNLIHLKTFDISSNNLTEILFNFLKGLKLLFKLNLSNNKIKKISLGSFRDLKMLRALDLSYNQISDLELGVFVGLEGLNGFDISHNKLTTLNDGVFHNLRYLQILNLSFNNLTYASVENSLAHLPILREIGLAGNGWSCNLLTSILKEYKRIRITNVGDFDVINVDGVACQHEITDPSDLINLETKNFTEIKSKLFTNNTLLTLILIVLVIKIILKYVPWISTKDKLKNKLRREKSEQELQLVNDC